MLASGPPAAGVPLTVSPFTCRFEDPRKATQGLPAVAHWNCAPLKSKYKTNWFQNRTGEAQTAPVLHMVMLIGLLMTYLPEGSTNFPTGTPPTPRFVAKKSIAL